MNVKSLGLLVCWFDILVAEIVIINHEKTKLTASLDIQQITTKNTDQQKNSGNGAKCIKEKNMNFSALAMVDKSTFPEESLAACVGHCLTKRPEYDHVLISYHDNLIFGDQFNCLCSDIEGFSRAPQLPEEKCDTKCPKSQYRCGNTDSDYMSVYCLKQSCLENPKPICSTRLPHDSHGCVMKDQVTWLHAHNVRNFSAFPNSHLACVWECHDHHPSALYSLTRKIGEILTCSCGYAKAFDPKVMITQEFCNMLPKNAPIYTVNCITDLDEDGSPEVVDPSKSCSSVLPIGCIYQELLASTSVITLGNMDIPDSQKCHLACSSTFKKAKHVAIRWLADSQEMKCFCLKKKDWNTTLVGPSSACDIPCHYKGSGLFCGGPKDKNNGYPALSLYCLHKGLTESAEVTQEEEEEEEVIMELEQSGPILISIEKAVYNSNLIGEFLVSLMTILCLILIALITYLCFSKGISSMSKQAM